MKPIICAVILFFTLILFAGCVSPITKDNYDSVKTAMTLDEVVGSILGSGTEQGSSDASFGGISMNVKNMAWQDCERIITVVFSRDKVQAKLKIGL